MLVYIKKFSMIYLFKNVFISFESNRNMNKTCITSESRQNELSERLTKTKEHYENVLNSNLLAEKKMRENK